jgi:thiosulfate/3-mercaptopyruvate sulfurtransferase
MTFVNRQYLVETEELAAQLADPTLRILDCTVFLRPPAVGSSGAALAEIESGRAAWQAGHIPGAAFVDLIDELSDAASPLSFTAPPAEQFAEAMSRAGVGEGTRVVCYDADANRWAARVWWLLRAFGFEDAAVLNGGWRKWTLEGRPISTDPPRSPTARFRPRRRPERIAAKEEVLAAIGQGNTCLVNALMPPEYRGEEPSPYGRPGRIPGSINVPARGLVDPATHAYLPAEQIWAAFTSAGLAGAERVITYCRGAIAASSDALLLTLLGVEDVAVYDGSLEEWAADPALPLEVG